ncbi:hypothetical protein BH24ACT15_BH24ACT15_29980 [soil metagenome]
MVSMKARNTDPETSHEAGGSVTELRTKQRLVLLTLRYRPATDEAMVSDYHGAERYGREPQSDSGLRTRRRELADKGLVEDTGERLKTVSGRNAIVWGVTEAGREVLR